MAHKVQSGQSVIILTVQIAVDPARVSEAHDHLSAALSLGGVYDPDSAILDWGHVSHETATAPDDPEEGEIFEQPRASLQAQP